MKEYGWCSHVKVLGFVKPGGSTALKIDHGETIYVYALTPAVLHVCCAACWRRLNPVGIIAGRPDPLPVHGPGGLTRTKE